jgi:hypothetical protein
VKRRLNGSKRYQRSVALVNTFSALINREICDLSAGRLQGSSVLPFKFAASRFPELPIDEVVWRELA